MFQSYLPGGMALALEGLSIFPRSVTIVNDELGSEFAETMGEKSACLLLGHGITTAGKSVEESTQISLNLQELARMNYMAYAIGKPKPILDPPDRSQAAEPRTRAGGRDYDRYAPSWRWQQQILDAEVKGF